MVMFQTGNEKVPDMLTSRQNLKFFLDLFANFLNFARAYDGHSSFTFKSTINIKFVFLYLILSVHNVWKGGGGGGGGGEQAMWKRLIYTSSRFRPFQKGHEFNQSGTVIPKS